MSDPQNSSGIAGLLIEAGGALINWNGENYVRQGTLSEKIARLSDERDELRTDLKQVVDQRDSWREQAEAKRKVAESAGDRIKELEEQLARLGDHTDQLTEKVDELEAIPLDTIQMQRANALGAARLAIQESGSASVFSKSASEKINSYAALLSTAQFITSGEVDYVVGEGEFIERHTDGVRVPAALEQTTEVGPGGVAPVSDDELAKFGMTRTQEDNDD